MPEMSRSPDRGHEGVWVVYSWDWNAYVLSIHNDELMALRAMERLGYPAHVKFVPFGADFSEAISG